MLTCKELAKILQQEKFDVKRMPTIVEADGKRFIVTECSAINGQAILTAELLESDVKEEAE